LPTKNRATAAFVGPFLAYVGVMAASRALGLPPQFDVPLRSLAAILLILFVSRPYVDLRPSRPVSSVLLGAGVFLLWIAPDLLFDYRHHWLFENSVLGKAQGSLSPDLRQDAPFLAIRAAASFLLVPILEELFWRGWLMRWLIKPDFLEVPLGTYARFAFWITAAFFASEHGPYWEVGLAAGVLYNWWCIRTRSLADCILAHAVTNAILSAYVLFTGRWEYWL
jgi:CAAX prenyl protease-like protein